MIPAEIVLPEDTPFEITTIDRKPVIVIKTPLANITIPAMLLRNMDQNFARSDKVRGCVCGYCGTNCSGKGRSGTCYCGQCSFDCWY